METNGGTPALWTQEYVKNNAVFCAGECDRYIGLAVQALKKGRHEQAAQYFMQATQGLMLLQAADACYQTKFYLSALFCCETVACAIGGSFAKTYLQSTFLAAKQAAQSSIRQNGGSQSAEACLRFISEISADLENRSLQDVCSEYYCDFPADLLQMFA